MIPKGKDGISETVVVGKVNTVNFEEEASVKSRKENNTQILDFYIPRGPAGEKGDIGPLGPKGEDGKDGASINIMGSYSTLEDLKKEHENGNIGDGYIIGDDLYVWMDNEKAWKNVGVVRGPKGDTGLDGVSDTITIGTTTTADPSNDAKVIDTIEGHNHTLDFVIPKGEKGDIGEKGDTGPTGPAGPEKIKSTYIITFNQNYTDEGIEVKENNRLPLEQKGVDSDNICTLNTTSNTLKFKHTGTYKIDFTVSCYVKPKDENTFSIEDDFMSVGFREIGGEIVFAGASAWSSNKMPSTLVGTGLFVVTDDAEEFELFNFTKQSIYLSSPNIMKINSESYFVNPLVKITIQYMGI